MVISELCRTADNILKDKEDHSFDRWCIIEDIGGYTREYCYLHPDEEVPEQICRRVTDAAEKRKSGYPLQYILGKWEFYGLDFKVGEGVLIPRPDTEVLVEAVLKRAAPKASGEKVKILDLCSGSGCIAVSLAHILGEKADVMALEYSSEAFPYLVENVKENGVSVKLLKGDVTDGRLLDNFRLESDEPEPEYAYIDCIVSNPPYLTEKEMAELQTEVTFEPETALLGGSDGLKFYRVIICLWKEILRSGGLMAFEIGTEQGQDVRTLLEKGGFENIFTENDAAGGVRVIGGFLSQRQEDDVPVQLG